MGQNFRLFRAVISIFAVIVGLIPCSAESLREELQGRTDEENIIFLSGVIWRSSLTASDLEKGDEAIRLIKEIDGYAEILANRLNTRRDDQNYENLRIKFFRVMSRIGGPAAIGVVASYLDDRTGAPTEKQLIDSIVSNSDTSFVDSNAVLAAEALDAMEISNAPIDKIPGAYSEEDVAIWKDWWSSQERKSEVLDSPNLEAKYSPNKVPHSAPADKGGSAPPTETAPSRLPWILGAIALLVIVVILVRATKSKGDSS